MKYVLTTCCKNKNASSGLLPAIDRYTDMRISCVYNLSKKRHLPFLLFSGKFGILKPEDPIPYYDFKLDDSMINKMVKIVTTGLKKLKASKIYFYGLDKNIHRSWLPYYSVIELACEKLNIRLEEIVLNEKEYL